MSDAIAALSHDLQGNRSLVRKFARVAEQVEQALTDLGCVGSHRAKVFLTFHLERVAVLLHQGLDGADHLLNHGRHINRLQEKIHLASLNFRNIEHIVDEPEQVLAGAVNFLQVGDKTLLAQLARVLLEHFAVTDDRVERCAQFVTHVGQERAFGAVGIFGCGLCFLRFGRRAGQFHRPLFDLLLQVLVVNFEHVIGMLQLGVPLLDDRQHFIKCVDERSDLISAALARAHQVVLFLRDHFRRARQFNDRLGDERLQFVGGKEGDQARNQHHHRHDIHVTIDAALQLFFDVGLEIKRADPSAIRPDRVDRTENGQTITLETGLRL